VIGNAVAGVILLTALVVWERRSPDPLIPLALFGKWSFASGNLASLLANIILFGLFFLMPFTFERVFGETAFSGGLRLTTIPLALGVLAPISGALSDRIGNRLLCTAGMRIAVCGLVLLSLQLGSDAPSLVIVTLALAVVGIGQGVFFAPNNNAIMGSASVSEAGEAGSLMNVTRDVGTSVGIAMAASLLSWKLRLLTGSSSTFAASAADLTDAIRLVVIVLALLGLLAAGISWARPVGRAPAPSAIDHPASNACAIAPRHIGGVTPSRPTLTRAASSVPSSFFVAPKMMSFAPGFTSDLSLATKVTIGVSGDTTTFFSPSLYLTRMF
jgi:hypothetical protein